MAGSFRELKRTARRQLHTALADTVLYLPERGATPVTITARIHDKFSNAGDIEGGQYAERHEVIPRIRFVDFQPKQGAVVVTEDMGAYLIGPTYPPHDISVDADVELMTASKAKMEGLDTKLPWCGLPPPEEE
ncbi:hypothetical protein [Bacteriophage Phobos]|uniref:Uncharacterized protein n=1 Tax=Bacteriophage Phobos TaxID=2662138 RepID=A0A5Q2U6X1_9CAUD|nr:hypothetical protein JT319_gp26 [Bacteriophage Phobos]QGH44995.1 hypothetical protein [Bacteriophage Phobos]WPK42391.1 hypothetical protein [Pseudomonas phage Ppu-503]